MAGKILFFIVVSIGFLLGFLGATNKNQLENEQAVLANGFQMTDQKSDRLDDIWNRFDDLVAKKLVLPESSSAKTCSNLERLLAFEVLYYEYVRERFEEYRLGNLLRRRISNLGLEVSKSGYQIMLDGGSFGCRGLSDSVVIDALRNLIETHLMDFDMNVLERAYVTSVRQEIIFVIAVKINPDIAPSSIAKSLGLPAGSPITPLRLLLETAINKWGFTPEDLGIPVVESGEEPPPIFNKIKMNFHIITLFPNAFDSYLNESILSRAIEDKKIKVSFYNPRDYSDDKWKRVDQKPYAGGPGMVIQALPTAKAVEKALSRIKRNKKAKIKIIFFSPSGKKFDTSYAKNSSKKYTDIVFVCGRYEGIDARVKKIFKMEDVSVGDYVLTGGELPAMIVLDCVARQVRGVLGNFDSLEESRVSSHDVYTRPEIFEYKKKKYRVPKVLLSGDHKKIEEWKSKKR